MEDTLVSFETLKLAREKGFHTPTEEMYSNITQSLLAKWLRDQHAIQIEILCGADEDYGDYSVHVGLINEIECKRDVNGDAIFYSNYELAMEEALQIALNLIKS